jgi:regulator of CtrA degradation
MQPAAYFRRTYDETLDLMVEARNYMAYVERRERDKAGTTTGLRMSCEAMRVTSRLTQVMAWLMMQRAVHEGEVELEEALNDHNRLSGEDVCLDDSFGRDEALPGGLRSLLERSLSLYQRISRLEAQMLDRVQVVDRRRLN